MALTSLFFYGTLRHTALLELVLGRGRDQMDLVEAQLDGHGVFWVKDQPFPMIAAADGQAASGLLLRDASEEDVARLDYYEGGFAYDLRTIQVRMPDTALVAAQVYFPQPGLLSPGAPFDLQDWVAQWGEISLDAAEDAMAHFGQWSAEELAVKLPMLRRRADTRRMARARAPSPEPHPPVDQVEVLTRTRVHSHFFALDRMELRHPRYDGTQSPVLDREVVFAGCAVVILPYDPVRDEVILVEQFRPNIFALGDPSPWVIEAIAGLVDPGETPETAAIREAAEEAGVQVQTLEQISAAYSSTGSNTEFLTTYVALADFSALDDGGGLASEGEDIRRIVIPYAAFEEGLRSFRFRDAPLIGAGFWLMANRDRLRGSA